VSVTGAGLMVAAHLGRPSGPVMEAMRARGVLTVGAGNEGVRFLPPFTLTAGEIDQIVEAFAQSLSA
jgi:acetylornithine/succinyldiaminopimelate/putrescine aminotransferase